ncbi:hypothetical protein PAERUG_P48_London_17_VIM_2_01_13_06546 [Pseudomonas aeruginosa]|nr:hypothetical protein PAERUG_P48_London_17_VIM_2_01_13_06546 [Pseudomonas aeruginosa]
MRLARRIDLGAVDLDQTDVDQRRFQACGRFPSVLALGADVRIDLHVVQTKGDQHLAIPFDGLHASANQMLGFRGGDDRVEVPIFRFIDRSGQRGDGARQERVTILGGDVLRTVEVADATGDQLVLLDRSQFGPLDQLGLEQSRLEGCGGLAFLFALVADVGIAPEVAEAKAHQRSLLGIVNADVALNELLGLGTRDLDVEVAVARVPGGADQRGDGAGQEGLRTAAAPDGHLTDTLEVADARGVEVEIRFLVGSGVHGESP